MSDLTDIEQARIRRRWDEIKARSLDDHGCYCAPCYFSFFHGVRHPDGGGYPCSKHATEDERREMEPKISEALKGLGDHPLMKMIRREPVWREIEDELRARGVEIVVGGAGAR